MEQKDSAKRLVLSENLKNTTDPGSHAWEACKVLRAHLEN